MILITEKQLQTLRKIYHLDKKKTFLVYADDISRKYYDKLLKDNPFIILSDDHNAIKGEELSFDSFRSFPSTIRRLLFLDDDALSIMVEAMMSKKRFEHSLSVAKTCKMLAKYHHVDQRKAYLAGLLHDVTKELPEEFHDSYLRYYDKDKLSYPLPIKHSFSASYYLKDKLGLSDSDVLQAIYNHTICSSNDRLCRIIYIADKREPLRGIDDGIMEIAKKDLHGAYEKLQQDVKAYLQKRGTDGHIIE